MGSLPIDTDELLIFVGGHDFPALKGMTFNGCDARIHRKVKIALARTIR